MIGGAVRHGRTRRDSRALVNHLLKDRGTRVELFNSVAPNLSAAVADMELARDGSSADAAFLHVHLSPARDMSRDELRQAADIVVRHLGAEGHQVALVYHDKPRRSGEGGTHAHLVLGRVGPDGQVLPSGFEKIRVETACRIAEFELGEPATLGRHHASGVKWLRANGRGDVADWMEAAHGTDPDKPGSAASPARRQGLARRGVDLASARDALQAAWQQSDGPQAFQAALRGLGLDVVPGDKPGVWVVRAGDADIGALDRIIKQKRAAVAARMEGFEHAADPVPAPHAGSAGHDEGHAGDLRPEPGSAPGRAAAPAAALAPRGGRGRGGQSDREAPGDPRDASARPAPAPSGDGGPAREGRRARLDAARLGAALKGFEPSQRTREAAALIQNESLAGRFGRLASTVLGRQLRADGGTGIDRLMRLAWDVRDTLQEVHLRLRYGRPSAQRDASADAAPVPDAAASADFRDRIRARIADRRRRGRDDDEAGWRPPRPW